MRNRTSKACLRKNPILSWASGILVSQASLHVKLSMVLTFFHSVLVRYLSHYCFQCFKSKSCATNSEGFEEFYVSHPGRSPVDWRSVLLIDRSSFGAVTHPTGMFMQFPNQASGERGKRENVFDTAENHIWQMPICRMKDIRSTVVYRCE